MASPEELVATYAVIVSLPDVLVLLPPAAGQVRTDEDVRAAAITGNIMAPAQIEEPGPMAAAAFHITETLAHVEIAQKSVRRTALVFPRCHFNHSSSRSMMTPVLMNITWFGCSLLKSSGKNIPSLTGTDAIFFFFFLPL